MQHLDQIIIKVYILMRDPIIYGILTLPPLENMKNINSTGSCYDSIPESLRIWLKILVQTLLKFILLANSFKKIARHTHVMDRY